MLMYPGYVKTGSKTHQMKEVVEPEEAAEKLWKVRAEKRIEDTGKFWHREGWSCHGEVQRIGAWQWLEICLLNS